MEKDSHWTSKEPRTVRPPNLVEINLLSYLLFHRLRLPIVRLDLSIYE
jgi:hypothetical protein